MNDQMWNFVFGADPEFEKIEELFLGLIIIVDQMYGSATVRAHLVYTISPERKRISVSSTHSIGNYLAGYFAGMLIQSGYQFEHELTY